jgi:large subunit ribosomal protein L18
MDASRARRLSRLRRRSRVRKRVRGTAERPRLAVFRSNRHIYAQLIDDSKGHTVAAAGSGETGVPTQGRQEIAKWVGSELAKRAKAAGVGSVVFDRGGYAYHGAVRVLADAAREGGLQF